MCTTEILLQLRRISRENLTDMDTLGKQARLKEFLREKLDKDYYSNTRFKFMYKYKGSLQKKCENFTPRGWGVKNKYGLIPSYL